MSDSETFEAMLEGFIEVDPDRAERWIESQLARIALRKRAAFAAQQKADPVALNNYVQPVPDHCDRITWRGRYFHLPLAAPPVDPEGIQLLREARQCVHKEANDEREIEGRGYQCYLADRIDAYLAKVQHEL